MTSIPTPYLAIVDRGKLEVFHILERHFASESDVVQVIWDRRHGERRAVRAPHAPERRQGERRREPPATWSTMGFVLVPDPSRHGGQDMESEKKSDRTPAPPPGGPRIARCPLHGIAYDEEREECPECAKGRTPPNAT
jgi:hypothetical protein